MAQTKKGPARPCRIFMCCQENTVKTARAFEDFMEYDREYDYGTIRITSLKKAENDRFDEMEFIHKAEWIIFFVADYFTDGFLKESEINPACVTAKEIVAIESARQQRKDTKKPLRFLLVSIDGGCFDKKCGDDLRQLFRVAGLLEGADIEVYMGLRAILFNSTADYPTRFIDEHIKPYCARPYGKSDSNTALHPAQELRKKGYIQFGNYCQTAAYEERPIVWQILDKKRDRWLLLSKYVLACEHYNDKKTTWEKSSMRRWLNETFLMKAFSDEERQLILKTTVPADNNPMCNTDPGNPTQDLVFLLSVPEARNYLPSQKDMRCAPTAFAKRTGVSAAVLHWKNYRHTCWWWLRTPGFDSSRAACVGKEGNIRSDRSVKAKHGGVRPALWIRVTNSSDQRFD